MINEEGSCPDIENANETVSAPRRTCSAELEASRHSTVLNSDESGTQPVCAICLESFHDGEMIGRSSNACCRHVFHPDCIIGWLVARNECPMCRQPFLKIPSIGDNESVDCTWEVARSHHMLVAAGLARGLKWTYSNTYTPSHKNVPRGHWLIRRPTDGSHYVYLSH
jgi:hypothetical protein